MTEFVQSFNRETGNYIKIHVRSGMVVGEQPQLFPGVEEVGPLEAEPAPSQVQADPLEMMR